MDYSSTTHKGENRIIIKVEDNFKQCNSSIDREDAFS